MIDNERKKIFIIAALAVLVIILFYFYLSSDSGVKSNFTETKNPGQILSGDKMQFGIDSILYSFGIKKEWIKKNPVKEKDLKNTKEKLLFSNDVKIPPDLMTIDLNYEISEYLRINNFRNKVTEDPKTRNIDMNILLLTDSVEKTIGSLRFIYSDTLKRSTADVCLVLDSIDEYSLSDAGKILNSTQGYSVFLPLRNDKADYQSKIIELKKNYLLKFSVGDEDDIEADFKEDMKENFWKSKIRSLSLNFPQTDGIILINKSSNAEFYKSVNEEFGKNNIAVYSDTIFSGYRNTGDKVTSLFEGIISETQRGKLFLFYDINFNLKEFDTYDSEVYRMKKSGYKFFNFKELMGRVNKIRENKDPL